LLVLADAAAATLFTLAPLPLVLADAHTTAVFTDAHSSCGRPGGPTQVRESTTSGVPAI